MIKPCPLILVTNDDGINSPGIWAAAEALDNLPATVKNLFSSGIATGGLFAIAMNLLLPRSE